VKAAEVSNTPTVTPKLGLSGYKMKLRALIAQHAEKFIGNG
jgi:hypothetical protein